MLKINKVLESATCALCDKDKEVASVVIEAQGTSEILLCWADVRKMTHMQMRMNGQGIGRQRTAMPVAEADALEIEPE